jgi:F-type H+-transporting ATPase subunit b
MSINRSNKKLYVFIVSVLVVAVVGSLALNAWAAEGHEGAGSFKKTWMKIWEILNFLILAFILFKLLKDPVKNFFRGRADMFREEIENSETASLEAERELKEAESRFETLDEEISRLRQVVIEQGENERQKIISDAKQTAEYMLEKARIESDRMIREAKVKLRREVIDEAVKIAEESVRRAISKKDQQRLIDEYLQNLTRASGQST